MNPPPIRLNLACGADWMDEEVINVDCRNLIPPGGQTFLRADISDLSDMFQDGAAVEIWAHDVLEHFPMRQVNAVLDEWTRLLAPGGLLHIQTPDMLAMAEFILHGNAHYGPNPSDEIKAYRLYGAQDYPENFHKAGFTSDSLSRKLRARGLEILEARPPCEGPGNGIDARLRTDSHCRITGRKLTNPFRFDGIKRVENLDPAMQPYYSAKDAFAAQTDHPGHSRNYYEWYYSYAQALRPATILEIGCFYGYSSIAMAMGHPALARLYLFDCGAYGVPLAEGVRNISRIFTGTILPEAVDTQTLTTLSLPESIDLIHVDGDHTAKGLAHDLSLVLPCLAAKGVIVVDDVTSVPELRGVCLDFAASHGLVAQYIPTFRGHVLLTIPDGSFPVGRRTGDGNGR